MCVLSHPVMYDPLQPHGLQPARLLCPWDSPGKNTGVGIHSFLLEIFPTQGLNLGLLHYRQILYHLSHQGSLSRVKIYSLIVLLSQFSTSCSMSSSNYCFLTCIKFLRRQVRWSGGPISLRIFQFVVFLTVKGFSIVNKAEVDVLWSSFLFL